MKQPVTIEKGVPIPAPVHDKSRSHAIRSMEIGDSFLVEEAKRASVPAEFKRLGMECTTRKEATGMVRVWRIK